MAAAEEEWVTWPQAAELVGCPVPTIDWYTRLGRIEKRPFRGPRPTLRRSSVVQFAGWWRERQAAREAARQARRQAQEQGKTGARRGPAPEPPSPTGWTSVRDAAAALGVTPSHVVWLVGRGRLEGQLLAGSGGGGRWWVRSRSVKELVRRRGEEGARWVSVAGAADLVGCSQSAILRTAHRGEIEQRRVDRGRPSLSRTSVEKFAQTWAARAQARAAQRARPPERPATAPPDEEHDWLTTREVAALLGRSPSRVNQLVRDERLPATARAGRHWYRADHVRLVLNARRAEEQAAQEPLRART